MQVAPTAGIRFPGVEPVGPRVSRFGIFVGPFLARQVPFRPRWRRPTTRSSPTSPATRRAARRHARDEVRRHVGRRPGAAARRRAAGSSSAKEEGGRVVAVLSAMGDTTDELVDARAPDLRPPEAARDGHADLRRRAHLVRARRDGDRGPRPRGDLAHRLAGRDRHRHDAHEGEDRRGARAAHPRGARRGEDRARRRLPGRLDRTRDHDARPRRLRHDRGRARGRARRRRAARSSPTSRASTPPTRGIVPGARKLPMRHLRGDARDVGLRREGDGATLSRVRPQPRRAPARALDLQRERRARGSARRTRSCWRRRSSRVSRTTPPRRR